MKKGLLKVLSATIIFMMIFTVAFPTINYAYSNINDIKEYTTNENLENEKTEKLTEENVDDKKEKNIKENENKDENAINEEDTREEVKKEEETVTELEIEETKNEDNVIKEQSNEDLKGTGIAKQDNKQLEDGIYTIASKIDENMVIEVPDKSREDEIKIQLAQKARGINKSQEVKITSIGNGYYTITFEHSLKVLDVPGASTESGVKLQQYTSNNTMAQQWIIKDAGEGYYYIISGCSGLYIDIPGGRAVERARIQLYQGNETDAQKFSFTKVEELKTDKIEDGTYYIESALNERKVISIDDGKYGDVANAHIWENNKKEYQKFDIKYNKDVAAYIITAVHSNKSLDVLYAGQDNYANVIQYRTHNGASEQWILKETEDGYYNIISKCNYLNLDVNGGNKNNGANIQMYEDNGTKAQKFKFEKAEKNEGTRTIEDGVYAIGTKIDSEKSLQIENSSISDNSRAKFEKKINRTNKSQSFEIKYLNNGYYQIKQQRSSKVLEVYNGKHTNEAEIVQNSEDNALTIQQWIIKDAGNGYFYIIARCNGLFMDIPGGNVEKNPIIQMYEGNGTNAQQFSLTKVEELETDKIEDGTYYIESALDERKVISVDDGKYGDVANVQIWENNKKEYQKFDIKYNKEVEAYIITAEHSNKSLDVIYAGQDNYTNVIQYRTHNGASEQWILKETEDGYYNIISKCNDLNLDINSGNKNNGANVQMYEDNGTNAQKFKFVKAEKNESTKIEDGIYNIIAKSNENKALQIENNSISNNAKAKFENRLNVVNKTQAFEISYLNNGYYTIKQYKSQKILEVKDGKHTNGTAIVQNSKDNTSTIQQWIIKDAGDGYFYIIARCNGLFIDIPGGNVEGNPIIQMYEGNKTNAQKFKLVKAEQEIEGEQLIEDGVYKIKSILSNNKYIDVSAGSYDNGANVQLWTNDNVQQQKFQLTYNKKENYYEIMSVNSGKVLDVQSNGKTDGSNVWQYEENNTDAQKWILQSAGNGNYYIVAYNSYLYLDVNGGNASNGANVQIYEGNETNSQKFKFEKTKMIDSDSYNISIKQDESKVIDIDAGSMDNGANVQIWTFDSVNQQIFKIEYVDDTYCKIIAKHSDKVLTVQGDNVVQNDYNGNDKQLWSFEIAGDGYYKVKSKSTNLYLDVAGNQTVNGTNVKIYEGNTSNAQQFKFKELSLRYGIDVSSHNGNVDWEEVRKSGKVDYAIIRAGYRGFVTGKIVTDGKFKRNVKEATKNGIDIGLYFFTQAVNEQEAVEEANYVLDLVRKYDVNVRYPIIIDTEYSTSKTNGVLDYEGRADQLDVATRTAVCRAFCDTIRNAGYIPAVYASKYWFYDNLDVSQLNSYDIWVAHYTTAKTTDYKYKYNMWQYTSSGSIPGVYAPFENGKVNVDMSICYKKY